MSAVHRQKILVLFAHPSQERSEVNVPIFNSLKQKEFVTLVDLYAEYPSFRIDIDREQERLVEHDVIVFMFPMYWYSTPSILKEWQDLVLEYGFAYGTDGKALHGKTFCCVLSAGGPKEAYKVDGYNHFTLRELLRPLEQTSNLTGMIYLPPLALYSARSVSESSERLLNHQKEIEKYFKCLHHGQLDYEKVKDLDCLNEVPLHEIMEKS